MSNVVVKVWNVEHGVCISIQTPNGRKAILDCGSSDSISPASEINSTVEKKKLDYLLISHPHQDHITDILELDKRFDIKVLSRNKLIDENKMKDDNPEVFDPPNDKFINKYFEISKRFTEPVSQENDPSNTQWGNGCTIHSFSNDDKSLEVNDLSMVGFVVFYNETILYGGDLKEKGWLEILKQEKFREFLKKTTIFIASHHGNESGYCEEIFKYFKPKVTIFSAGRYKDFAIKKYEEKTKGITVYKRSGGTDNRLVLTTRNDGDIDLVLYPSSSLEPTIRID